MQSMVTINYTIRQNILNDVYHKQKILYWLKLQYIFFGPPEKGSINGSDNMSNGLRKTLFGRSLF